MCACVCMSVCACMLKSFSAFFFLGISPYVFLSLGAFDPWSKEDRRWVEVGMG